MFDHVIMVVAEGIHKDTVFSLDERMDMCHEIASNYSSIEVKPVRGLLADFLNENQCQLVLRGMRTVADFDYEMQLADINRRLGDVETVFMAPPTQYIHVFSSLVREVARLGGNVDHYVRPYVAKKLAEKYHKQ